MRTRPPHSLGGLVSTLVIIVALLMGAAPWPACRAWAQQAALDPQSLIGEWSGSWKSAGAVQHEQAGRYYLTIEKVEAARVQGKGRVEGRSARDFKFTGRLTGDHLTFGQENISDFTISGNQIRGTVKGRVNWDVELSKQK